MSGWNAQDISALVTAIVSLITAIGGVVAVFRHVRSAHKP